MYSSVDEWAIVGLHAWEHNSFPAVLEVHGCLCFHGCSADAGVLVNTACHCAADMRLSPMVKKASAYMNGRPVPFAEKGTWRGGAWRTIYLRVSRELLSASVSL